MVPAIVVGDHGHGRVADLCLTGQLGFLQVSHADNIGAPTAIKIRFGAGGELRALHADIDAARLHHHPGALCTLLDGFGYRGADRIAKGNVADDPLSEESGVAQSCAVDELIGNNELGRLMLQLERADCGDGDDSFHAQLLHGEDIGAEVQLGGQ